MSTAYYAQLLATYVPLPTTYYSGGRGDVLELPGERGGLEEKSMPHGVYRAKVWSLEYGVECAV